MSCSTVTTQSDPSVASSRNPTIIGHRGGSLEVPENTLAAFRYSRDLGLKWLELDVRMAADGVVVCHDAFLGRLGKRPDIEVWKTPITALKEISVGDPMPSEYALGKLEEFGLSVPRFGDAYANETIPTLIEALQAVEDIHFMVELKEGPYGAVLADEAIADIRQVNALDRVLLGSFDLDLLDRAAQLAPDTPLIGIAEEPEMIPELLKRPIRYLAVSEDLVDLALKSKPASVTLWVWTIRDLSEAKRLVAKGVDGLISDIPKKVRDGLNP